MPPPRPQPKVKKPSRALFYEDEDGTIGDRDLWRDILGDDFPDDLPPEPKIQASYRDRLVRFDLNSARVVAVATRRRAGVSDASRVRAVEQRPVGEAIPRRSA